MVAYMTIANNNIDLIIFRQHSAGMLALHASSRLPQVLSCRMRLIVVSRRFVSVRATRSNLFRGRFSARGQMALLIIEPFYGGSHAQLIDLLKEEFSDAVFVTLPAKKWHWRARTAALHFAEVIPKQHRFRKLLCSSVLNLAELGALRPDLASLEKIIYFHENQLVYPVQEKKDRDFQYGYNQVLSCLTADRVVFNSEYNQDSFLSSLKSYFSITPGDQRPKEDLAGTIRKKCAVLYFPLRYPTLNEISVTGDDDVSMLHIVWPHRWEHDKNPESLCQVLKTLKANGYRFRISLLGEQYEETPDSLASLRNELSQELYHVGFLPSKQDYYRLLQSAHVAVSTATHEFFGVAMLEATYCGCYPICPNRLVYSEIFPTCCLYNTDNQLLKMLKNFCKRPEAARKQRQDTKIDFDKYSWLSLRDHYRDLLS